MKISVLKIITVSLLTCVVVLTSACGNNPQNEENITEQTAAVEDVAVQQTDAQPEETDANIAEETELASASEQTTVSGQTIVADEVSEPESTTESTVPATTEEIVALFNQSANRIKTESILVVKNYEKRTVNQEHVSIPKAIEGMTKTMLTTVMKDDVDPIAYSTREEIRTEFIVPDQSYVSRLKASDLVEASCKDTGKTYEIYFKLKDESNPTAGKGVGSVCDVIETHEIAEGPDFIEEFSTRYYNCEIKAVYNKASGRITHITYKTPVIMKMKVNLLGHHSGSMGFTFEKDFSITY